jgi:hypothetical protein
VALLCSSVELFQRNVEVRGLGIEETLQLVGIGHADIMGC